MSQAVRVAKIGKRADSTDPNDYIFHSDYNTFKILVEVTDTFTITASSTGTGQIAHGLGYVPLVTGFAKRTSASQVFLPNGIDVELFGVALGAVGDLTFNYISADDTNVNFNFSNASGGDIDVEVKGYCLERI